MDKKTAGIIATVATALLCGCPGLAGLCWGALAAVAGLVPGADIDIMGNQDPRSAMLAGLGALCLGIIFVAIPIVVGIITLRKPRPPAPTTTPNEPLPPAI